MREEQEIEVELSTTAHLVYHDAPSLKWVSLIRSNQAVSRATLLLEVLEENGFVSFSSFKKPPAFLCS